jgi:pimeloyl-ACP methyl ester carboxylesterase
LLQVVMMGFAMGGYIAAAFAAAHPDLLAGVLMGGCCTDAHSLRWQLLARMTQATLALRTYRAKSQV